MYEQDYVYDLEIYPNCFTAVFANEHQKRVWVFEISNRKDDSSNLRKFLTGLYKEKARMVGFNNIGFDYPLLHWWLQNKGVSVNEIYEEGMRLIESSNDDRFANTIPEHKQFIKQIDLYKINHYDNRAKATGLKMIEFNMRSKNIEDLPFDVGTMLTDEQIDVLIKYNRHDVMETLKFYNYNKDAIELRETLIDEYGIPCMNFNDTKIGKEYFVKQLEETMPGSCYKQQGNGRKINQTKRDSINLADIIFPYVEFKSPVYQSVLDWIKKQTITETKGVFSDIPEHELGELAKCARLTTKKKKLKQYGAVDKNVAKELRKQMKDESLSEDEVESLRDKVCGVPKQQDIDLLMKEHPCGWVERIILKSGKTSWNFHWRIAESLNVVIDGLEYVFGTGGLHASRESVTYVANNEYTIIDLDVRSYYPNMFISNRVYPEHLSETFCDIYKEVYLKRKSYPKGTPQNAVMKLALNGTYGATNDQYSPFYDSQSTMAITVNGQFTLCLLIEELLEIKNLEMIQANSDGITFICKRESEPVIDELVKQWEAKTKLEMEKVVYSKMAIRDVNNYIAIYENGKTKRNGAYEYKIAWKDGEGLAFHQNQSMVIVKKAAHDAIVHGIPVEDTIRKCKDPFDFCLRTKVPRSSRIVLMDEKGIRYPEQNTCRYYIANKGKHLVKIMPPLVEGGSEREMGINKGLLVKTCNNMDDFDWDINYDFYIEEAKKLVDGVGLKEV
jgi:hypothetical protein